MKFSNILKKIALVAMLQTAIFSDQVILDDLIVDGSECVGYDCVQNEQFSFSTIKLKENNLRIEFTDTSGSSSFPSNDWQITINDSANGGEDYFSVDDITSGKKLLKIKPDGSVAMGYELDATFLLSTSGDLNIRGTLSDSSDVNLKENISPVQSNKILKKIETLSISTWNYKNNKNKDIHIGAMAQDFYKAFQYGKDNLHIAPKDAAFVAMVGVQELVQKIKERDAQIAKLNKRVEELESLETSIKNLEALVKVLLNPKKELPLASIK